MQQEAEKQDGNAPPGGTKWNRRKRKRGMCFEDRPVLEPHAAGIDIGAREMFVAVPPDRDENPVRVFATFTEDLEQLADWLAQCGVQTLYIEPGKPWQNGKEGRFNGTVRDECLNLHVFTSVAEACVRSGTFLHHYNHERPHSQLGYLAPLVFKAAWLEAQAKHQDP